MTDPRSEGQQADGSDANTQLQSDPSRDLDIRPEDIDHVKGGAKPKTGDPCDGGEISTKLG